MDAGAGRKDTRRGGPKGYTPGRAERIHAGAGRKDTGFVELVARRSAFAVDRNSGSA